MKSNLRGLGYGGYSDLGVTDSRIILRSWPQRGSFMKEYLPLEMLQKQEMERFLTAIGKEIGYES